VPEKSAEKAHSAVDTAKSCENTEYHVDDSFEHGSVSPFGSFSAVGGSIPKRQRDLRTGRRSGFTAGLGTAAFESHMSFEL
jgi:hypothetical protein